MNNRDRGTIQLPQIRRRIPMSEGTTGTADSGRDQRTPVGYLAMRAADSSSEGASKTQPSGFRVSRTHCPPSSETREDRVYIPQLVNVNGYTGGRYREGSFSLSKLTHRRMEDRAYSALDAAPACTDVIFVIDLDGQDTDALWLQVVNPEEPDNAKRRYVLVSSNTADRDENGDIRGRLVEPGEIEGIAATLGKPLIFNPNSAREQITTTGTVVSIITFDRNTRVDESLAAARPNVDAFAAFRR